MNATPLYREEYLLQLILAWGFVGIPLLAGVTQTIINATQLFR